MKTTEQEVATIIFETEIFLKFKSVAKKEVWGNMEKIIKQISSSINTYHLNELKNIDNKTKRFKYIKDYIESELNYFKSM